MSEHNYGWSAPDFEVRCNSFVEEVTKTVAPKYPNLKIEAVNETVRLTDATGRIEEIRRLGIKDRTLAKFMQTIERTMRSSDIDSATFNQAVVDIWGNDELTSDMLEAESEIGAIAAKYKPKEAYENRSHDTSGICCTHMGFIFDSLSSNST